MKGYVVAVSSVLAVVAVVNACSDGWYGHHCEPEYGQCEGNLVCNPINGLCDQGCQSCFQEAFCKDRVDGMYGYDSTSRRDEVEDAVSRDKPSAECPERCLGNFTKPMCEECQAASGLPNWLGPGVATLWSLLLLAAIALIASAIYIGRLKKQLAAPRDPKDNYMSLDKRTMEHIEESIYDVAGDSDL